MYLPWHVSPNCWCLYPLQLRSIIPIGPLLPDSMFCDEGYYETNASALNTEKLDPVLQWLDTQPRSSVIYVSFGSLATLSASQLIEMAMGLEASGQRFIWVVRSPSDLTRVAPSSEVHQYLPSGSWLFPIYICTFLLNICDYLAKMNSLLSWKTSSFWLWFFFHQGFVLYLLVSLCQNWGVSIHSLPVIFGDE